MGFVNLQHPLLMVSKPFKNELGILKEIRGRIVTAKSESRRECMSTIRLIFPGTYLLGIKLLDIRSQKTQLKLLIPIHK